MDLRKKRNTKPRPAVSFMEELFKRMLYFVSTMSGSLYDVTPMPLYCVWRWRALAARIRHFSRLIAHVTSRRHQIKPGGKMEVKLLHLPGAIRLSEQDRGKPPPLFHPTSCQYSFPNYSINSAGFTSPWQYTSCSTILLTLEYARVLQRFAVA